MRFRDVEQAHRRDVPEMRTTIGFRRQRNNQMFKQRMRSDGLIKSGKNKEDFE